jgi:hypothetical protein
MNYVKVKLHFRQGGKSKPTPMVSWLEENKAYAIIDVYKYLEKNKESGKSIFKSWFLVGNPETGEMGWVESHTVDYAGWDLGNTSTTAINPKSNIGRVVEHHIEGPESEPSKKFEVKGEGESGPKGISFAF